jgi:integrase
MKKTYLKPYREARISKGKNWYIYYWYQNPVTGVFKLFKDRGGLNYPEIRRNPAARKRIAKNLCDAQNEQLRGGWSPFGDTLAQTGTKEDPLQFEPAIKVLTNLYEIKKNTVKRRTWQSYKYAIDILKAYLKKKGQENIMLEFITEKFITEMFDSLQVSGNYKNISINNHANNLSVIFNMAVKRELIDKSPLRNYSQLPQEHGKNFPYSDKQKAKLKEYMLANDPEMWLFVKCIYHLFVRPIELLQIKVSDIDFRTKQIVIHSERGKNKKQLGISIPDSFIEELQDLKLHTYPDNFYLFGRPLKPSEKKYSRNEVSARYKLIKEAVGIKDSNFTLYGWKHSGNVDSYLAGVDIYDLMRQNRHHSIAQTETYLRSMGLRPNKGYSVKAPRL